MIILPELPSSPRDSRGSLVGRFEPTDPEVPETDPGRVDSDPPRRCRFPSELDDDAPVLDVDDVGACVEGKHKRRMNQ